MRNTIRVLMTVILAVLLVSSCTTDKNVRFHQKREKKPRFSKEGCPVTQDKVGYGAFYKYK